MVMPVIAIVFVILGYFHLGNAIIWLIGGALIVLVMPGFSMVRLIFSGRSMDEVTLVTLILGISLCVCALGGLFLNWLPGGLTKSSWIFLLGSVIFAGLLISILRGRNRQENKATIPLRNFPLRKVFLLLLSITITIIAYIIASHGAIQQKEGFTQLWILPDKDFAPNSFDIGVNSRELNIEDFKIIIKLDKLNIIDTAFIKLTPGQNWEKVITIPDQQMEAKSIEADLYLLNSSTLYRQVNLSLNN